MPCPVVFDTPNTVSLSIRAWVPFWIYLDFCTTWTTFMTYVLPIMPFIKQLFPLLAKEFPVIFFHPPLPLHNTQNQSWTRRLALFLIFRFLILHCKVIHVQYIWLHFEVRFGELESPNSCSTLHCYASFSRIDLFPCSVTADGQHFLDDSGGCIVAAVMDWCLMCVASSVLIRSSERLY